MSMFWKFAPLPSQLDSILDKEDVQLSEVMEEDDVVQELKCRNQKLIELLLKAENVTALINHVINEPSEELAHELRYKLSNTATELLSADVGEINDTVISNEEHLLALYNFFSSNPPLNPLLASFVVKIFTILIHRKGEALFRFFKEKTDFIERIIKHIGTSAVTDFLLKFIQYPDSVTVRAEILEWLTEQGLIPRLIAQLSPMETEEKHYNVCQCLFHLLLTCREQTSQSSEGSEMLILLDSLESRENLNILLGLMFDSEIKDSVIINGLQYFHLLMERRKCESPLDSLVTMSQFDLERLAIATSNVMDAISPRLSQFYAILKTPPKQFFSDMPTTCGQLSPPFGNARLQVMRIMSSLFALNQPSVNTHIHDLGFLALILDLFIEYRWNTFFHKVVEDIFSTIIMNATPESSSSLTEPPSETTVELSINQKLLRQLLIDCEFIKKIIDIWTENKEEEKRPDGKRRGYMGHLTSLANILSEHFFLAKDTSPFVQCIIAELNEDLIENWTKFHKDELTPWNQLNKLDIHSFLGDGSSSDDDDIDYKFQSSFPLEMQQTFADYQSQYLTTSFLDHFGYNEDEFSDPLEKIESFYGDQIANMDFSTGTPEDTRNATMFEQACNEEIRQFDDSEDEEGSGDDEPEEDTLEFSGNSTIPGIDPMFIRTSMESGGSRGEDDDDDEEGGDESEDTVRPLSLSRKSRPETARGRLTDGDGCASGRRLVLPPLNTSAEDDPVDDMGFMDPPTPLPDFPDMEVVSRIKKTDICNPNNEFGRLGVGELQMDSSGSSDDDDEVDLSSPRVILSTSGRSASSRVTPPRPSQGPPPSRGQTQKNKLPSLAVESMDIDDEWPDMENKTLPSTSPRPGPSVVAWQQDNNNSSPTEEGATDKETTVPPLSNDKGDSPGAQNKTEEAEGEADVENTDATVVKNEILHKNKSAQSSNHVDSPNSSPTDETLPKWAQKSNKSPGSEDVKPPSPSHSLLTSQTENSTNNNQETASNGDASTSAPQKAEGWDEITEDAAALNLYLESIDIEDQCEEEINDNSTVKHDDTNPGVECSSNGEVSCGSPKVQDKRIRHSSNSPTSEKSLTVDDKIPQPQIAVSPLQALEDSSKAVTNGPTTESDSVSLPSNNESVVNGPV